MSTAKWQNIAGSKKFFSTNCTIYSLCQIDITKCQKQYAQSMFRLILKKVMFRPKDHYSMNKYPISLKWNPRKLGMYQKSKLKEIMIIQQQLEVFTVSSSKTVLYSKPNIFVEFFRGEYSFDFILKVRVHISEWALVQFQKNE